MGLELDVVRIGFGGGVVRIDGTYAMVDGSAGASSLG
jgi:hypothetical protein